MGSIILFNIKKGQFSYLLLASVPLCKLHLHTSDRKSALLLHYYTSVDLRGSMVMLVSTVKDFPFLFSIWQRVFRNCVDMKQ